MTTDRLTRQPSESLDHFAVRVMQARAWDAGFTAGGWTTDTERTGNPFLDPRQRKPKTSRKVARG